LRAPPERVDMSIRNDVPPKTVGIDLREEGVAVEYADGRLTLYHGVPERVTGSLTTPPGKEVHVLVTDPTETEGVMMYVNDLTTEAEILEDTGVGRVVLSEGEQEELFPGVTARSLPGERLTVEADPELARGRVFVFVEDQWAEKSYEFVPHDAIDDEEPADETDESADGDPDDDADGG
jgi:hypothetical protein